MRKSGWLRRMWVDIVLALAGGLTFGVTQGLAAVTAGDESPALVGAIYAVAWAALWMAVATHRESIRSRRAAARERRASLAAPLEPSSGS